LAVGLGGFSVYWLGIEFPMQLFLTLTIGATLIAGLLVRFYVQFAVSRRIRQVATVLEGHAEDSGLQRLPNLGEDEIGEIGRAVNKLLANLTSLEVQMIEQGRELILKQELEAKSAELEQRLSERALLFDVVRASASERELDQVLADIAARIGRSLTLRECLLFLNDADTQRLVLQAAHGVSDPSTLLGRTVLLDEAPIGQTAREGQPLVFGDVAEQLEPGRLWLEIAHRGSLALFPVMHKESAIGVLAVTRDREDAFSPVELGLLSALAEQLGLAIRHTQLFDELRRGSQQDDLTGLGNRRLLRARLEDEQLRCERFGQAVSVLAIDIDFFKQLNDRCGHPTGDAALRRLASVMTRNLRRIDTIARTGGEEFVVVLPRTNLAEAKQVGEKLRHIVEETSFPGGASQPAGALTVSIGIATLHGSEDVQQMLSRADAALYEAKAKGRNRVVVANQAAGSMRSLTRSRI
jgi:diguanylate cyclase (GGDEF)-like protein